MKQYTIEAVALGSYWVKDVNCPMQWLGSGVYDVEYTTVKEAVFTICAMNLKDALKEIPKAYGEDFDTFYYDPKTVKEEKWGKDEDGDEAWVEGADYDSVEYYERDDEALAETERYREEIV